MDITTYTDFRQNMRAYIEKVFFLRKPLFISRPKGKDMVLISKEEYTSMQETLHLLQSPKNAERLLMALKQDQTSHEIERKLIEE